MGYHKDISMVISWIPSGKRLQKNELENHHAIYGKINYFYGYFQ